MPKVVADALAAEDPREPGEQPTPEHQPAPAHPQQPSAPGEPQADPTVRLEQPPAAAGESADPTVPLDSADPTVRLVSQPPVPADPPSSVPAAPQQEPAEADPPSPVAPGEASLPAQVESPEVAPGETAPVVSGWRRVAAAVGGFVGALPRRITDSAVLAFALFTVLYHAAFLLELRPSTIFLTWLVCCAGLAVLAPVLGVLRAVRRRRRARTAAPAPTPAPEPAASRRWWWWLAPIGTGLLGIGAAILAGVGGIVSWWVPVLLGLAAAVGGALLARRTWLERTAADEPVATPWQALYVLLISAGVAVSSLYMARNTPDDVFYVGKSVWVAERDIVPLRDFLFTENVAAPLSTQPPIASIEVFAGALARFLGLHAGDATWFVLLPALAVLAVLALWRLVHRWAPRRPVLAFTVALAYLYLVVGSDASLGTFHLPRLYEGKGMFVSAVVPLMWVYLTDWFESRSKWKLFLVFALSVVATGLTSTSAIILPLLVGAAGLAMLLVGRWRSALAVGIVALLYPAGSVVVSRLVLGPVTEAGGETQFFDAEGTYRRTLLVGTLGVIGGLALWLGPLLVRRRTPRLLAAGAAVTMTVLFVPGVLEWLADVTGVPAVLWRVPWILALPGLIGILCTIGLPRLKWSSRLAGAIVAGLLVFSFTSYGVPMWDKGSFIEVAPRPLWKLPQQRLEIVRWIEGLPRQPGLLLAPSTLMRTAPIVSSRLRVVNPRAGYLIEYDQNSDFVRDRQRLTAFADGTAIPPLPELSASIERLDVTTICVYWINLEAKAALRKLGYEQYARRFAPGAVRCFRKWE
ncbi:DUF6077 domain-containing protein [Micromonospora sp. DT233]|uniref:DUF6077 domain-containing protein n=1 Tax=Micromonospora sp. DT233 TaxID=3393432 RepID=UPI003CE703AA